MLESKMPSTASAQLNVTPTAEDALHMVLTSLQDAKADSIETISITEKSALADYMVFASGSSHRHVGSIADKLTRLLKGAGVGRVNVEGLPHCDWVVVDTADVIVHIFRPEVREFYNLEKMWRVAAPAKPISA